MFAIRSLASSVRCFLVSLYLAFCRFTDSKCICEIIFVEVRCGFDYYYYDDDDDRI